MASKIDSVSEANIGFPLSFSIRNLRRGLLEHFFESSLESEDNCSSIFSDKSSREDMSRHTSYEDMSYEESHSAQDNLRKVSQRSDMEIQRIKIDSKKKQKPYFCRNSIVYAISIFL